MLLKIKRNTGKPAYLLKANEQKVNVDIYDPEIRQQLAMIGLREEDLKWLKAFQPIVADSIEAITESFYQTILDVGSLNRIIQQHSTVDRLKVTLKQHLIEIFNGRLDDEFLQKRLKIAQVHQHIGLDPKWYIAAFQNVQQALFDLVDRHVRREEEKTALRKAINKFLNFEQQIVLEAYEKENIRILEQQHEIKNELKDYIARISQELAALTEETSASVQQLLSSSSEVKQSFRVSAEQSRQTQSFAREGLQKVENLDLCIKEIAQSTHHMQQAVQKLNESSKQISDIVGIVQDIANQIKLLSLNASIEAARAGEHGKGFSVVAGEVQKLSVNTKDTVSRISELINQSIQVNLHVVQSIQEVQRYARESQNESAGTRKMFDEIVRSMTDNMEQMAQVEKEMESLVLAIEEISLAADKVAESTEELNQSTKNL